MSELTYDSAVEHLACMFPSFDRTVIATMIQVNNGHIEKTVESMLMMEDDNNNNNKHNNGSQHQRGEGRTVATAASAAAATQSATAGSPQDESSLARASIIADAAAATSTSTGMIRGTMASPAHISGRTVATSSIQSANASIEGARFEGSVVGGSGGGGGGGGRGPLLPDDFLRVPGGWPPRKGSDLDIPARLAQERQDRLLAEALQNELFRSELMKRPEFRNLLAADVATFHREREQRRRYEAAASAPSRAVHDSYDNNKSSSTSSGSQNGKRDEEGDKTRTKSLSEAVGGMGTALRNRLNLLALQFRSNAKEETNEQSQHGMYTRMSSFEDEDDVPGDNMSSFVSKSISASTSRTGVQAPEMIELTSPVSGGLGGEGFNSAQGKDDVHNHDRMNSNNFNRSHGEAQVGNESSQGTFIFAGAKREGREGEGRRTKGGYLPRGEGTAKGTGFWTTLTSSRRNVGNQELSEGLLDDDDDDDNDDGDGGGGDYGNDNDLLSLTAHSGGRGGGGGDGGGGSGDQYTLLSSGRGNTSGRQRRGSLFQGMEVTEGGIELGSKSTPS